MITVTRKLLELSLVGALLCSGTAQAFCEDSKTGVSGYRIPLEEEVKSSFAIVVGQVITEDRVFDVIDDPEYYHSIFTVRVDRQLKGKVPTLLTFRVELTSARYDMSLGQKHVLFLRNWPWKIVSADYVIDSCGNSAPLPEGDVIVSSVAAQLHAARMRPNTSLERTRAR
jgi:hypothetical protein